MNIGSICNRDLVCIDAAASPDGAARLMRDRHVGSLLVTSHDGGPAALKGVLTDRDLVVRALALGSAAPQTVGPLVQPQVVGVHEDDDLLTAIDVMRDHGVRRLLVVDAAQNVIGLVSLDDLLGACAHEVSGLAQALQKGLRQEASTLAPPPVAAPPRLAFPSMGTLGWSA